MSTASVHEQPTGLRDPGRRHPPERQSPGASQFGSLTDAPARRPHRGTRRTLVVRESEPLTGLSEDEQRDLREFALEQPTDTRRQHRPVLALRNGRLHAQNYVGVIETRRGTVLEILPKVDLSNARDDALATSRLPGRQTGASTGSSTAQDEETRRVFLTMLRDWRGLGEAQFDAAGIRAVRRFNMLEAFIHLFLTSVVLLTRRGLARAYRTREANLPCLRGRILFPPHVRENLVDRSRFYVGYDEFTADRPANRLIHLALLRLSGVVRHPANRQRLHQLRIVFSGVPPSTNLDDDWARHRVDRSMQHYDRVMPWVGLFLLRQGLATFAGPHVNRALLFPMEEVFEDFVTAAVRRHQRQFTVCAQGPMRPLATDGTGQRVFWLKPDIVLKERDQARFILDAKWKRLDPGEPNHGVSQADVYQLFAYGKRYGCRRVVLLYPKTTVFREEHRFRFVDDELELSCFPFDVIDPEGTVSAMMRDCCAELSGLPVRAAGVHATGRPGRAQADRMAGDAVATPQGRAPAGSSCRPEPAHAPRASAPTPQRCPLQAFVQHVALDPWMKPGHRQNQ